MSKERARGFLQALELQRRTNAERRRGLLRKAESEAGNNPFRSIVIECLEDLEKELNMLVKAVRELVEED